MTRARSLVSVLTGALLATGALAGCSKDKTEAPAEQAALPEEPGESGAQTSPGERPVPKLPDTAGKDVEATEGGAPEAAPDGERRGRWRGRSGERRAAMLERFDQNQDGKIDDSERTAMRSQRAARMVERFDTNGDGSLSGDELTAMQGRRRGFDAGKADANGDGSLSAAELETHMTQRSEERMRARQARRAGQAAEAGEAAEENEGTAAPQ
jgi:EF hand